MLYEEFFLGFSLTINYIGLGTAYKNTFFWFYVQEFCIKTFDKLQLAH